MKLIGIGVFLFLVSIGFAQDSVRTSGFGMGIGPKQPYGLWGVFYQFTPKNLDLLEFNAGLGINKGMIVGLGPRFKIISNLKSYEMLVSINYSYRFSSDHRYESNSNIDYYTVSDIQNMSYYFTNRFKVDTKFYLQGNIGYSQNISGYSIHHVRGLNDHLDKVENNLKSGLLIGIDVIVFPFD
ncbi:MAG: hypothetical protein KDC83_14645 [Flavobacteriales bacterium]|nr:hypothetical protein [Flavobacteriales bacterium]